MLFSFILAFIAFSVPFALAQTVRTCFPGGSQVCFQEFNFTVDSGKNVTMGFVLPTREIISSNNATIFNTEFLAHFVVPKPYGWAGVRINSSDPWCSHYVPHLTSSACAASASACTINDLITYELANTMQATSEFPSGFLASFVSNPASEIIVSQALSTITDVLLDTVFRCINCAPEGKVLVTSSGSQFNFEMTGLVSDGNPVFLGDSNSADLPLTSTESSSPKTMTASSLQISSYSSLLSIAGVFSTAGSSFTFSMPPPSSTVSFPTSTSISKGPTALPICDDLAPGPQCVA